MSSQSDMAGLCTKLAVGFTANVVKGVQFSNPITGVILETLLGLLSEELDSTSAKLDAIDKKLATLLESYYKDGYCYL